MIRSFTRYRRPVATLALLLMVAFLMPPASANADDRKLLTSGTARPNVLIILDTSGSMAGDFSNSYYTAGGMDDPDVAGDNFNDPTPCHNGAGVVVPCVNAACAGKSATDPCHLNDPVDAPQSKLATAKDVLKTFVNTVENGGNPTMNLGFTFYFQDYGEGGFNSSTGRHDPPSSPGIRVSTGSYCSNCDPVTGSPPPGISPIFAEADPNSTDHGKQWLYTAAASDGTWKSPSGYDSQTSHGATITQGEPLQFGNITPWGWRSSFAPNGATFTVQGFSQFNADATGTVIVNTTESQPFFDMTNSFDSSVNNASGFNKIYGFDPQGHRFLAWQVIPNTGNQSPWGDDPNDNPSNHSCTKQVSDATFSLHEIAQMCSSSVAQGAATYAHPVTLYHHTKYSYNTYKHMTPAVTEYAHSVYKHNVVGQPTTYVHYGPTQYMHNSASQYVHPAANTMYVHMSATTYMHSTPTTYMHQSPTTYRHLGPTTYMHAAATQYMHPGPTTYKHPAPTQYNHTIPTLYVHFGVRTAYYNTIVTCTQYDYNYDPPKCIASTTTCDYNTEVAGPTACSAQVSDDKAPCNGVTDTNNDATVCNTIAGGCGQPDTNPANACGNPIVDTNCQGVTDTDPTNACSTIQPACNVGPDTDPTNSCQTIAQPCSLGPDTNSANACQTIAPTCNVGPDTNSANPCQTIAGACNVGPDTNSANACQTIAGVCNIGPDTNSSNACQTIAPTCSVVNTTKANHCDVIAPTCTGNVNNKSSGACAIIPGTCTVGPDTDPTNACSSTTPCNGPTDTNNDSTVCQTNPGTPSGCISAWDTNSANACLTDCGDGTAGKPSTWDTNPNNACASRIRAGTGVCNISDHDSTNTCGASPAGHDAVNVSGANPASLTDGAGPYPYFQAPANANGHGVVFDKFDWFDSTNTKDYRTDGSEVFCGDGSTLSGPDPNQPGWNYRDATGAALRPPSNIDSNSTNACKTFANPNGQYKCASVTNLVTFSGKSANVTFDYAGQFAGSSGSGNNAKPVDFTVDGSAGANTCTGYMTQTVPPDVNDTPIAPIPKDSANGGSDAEAVEVDEYIKTFLVPAASRSEYHKSSNIYQCYGDGFTLYNVNQTFGGPGDPSSSWDSLWQSNSSTAAQQVFNGLGAVGGTPIVGSLNFAKTYFQNDVLQRVDQLSVCRLNYVILLTDGLESCDTSDPNSPCAVAEALRQMKVAVFVVAVGTVPSDPSHICNVPGVGNLPQLDGISTQNVDKPVYKHIDANNRQELLDALNGIVQKIADETKAFATPSSIGSSGISATGAVGTFQPSSARNAQGLVGQKRSIWDGHLTLFPLVNGYLPVDVVNRYQLDFKQAIWDAAAPLASVDPTQNLSAGTSLNTKDTKIQYILPPLETLVAKDYPNTQYFTGRKVLFGLPNGSVPETAYDLLVPTTIPADCTTGANPSTPWCQLKGFYDATNLTNTSQTNYMLFTRGARDSVLGITPDGTDPASYAYRYLDVNNNPSGGNPAHSKSMLGDIFHSEPLVVGAPSNLGLFVNNATYDDSGNLVAPCRNCASGSHSYQDFFHNYQTRRKVIYAGANDTLFHAFDAGVYGRDAGNPTDYDTGTGAELFSYAPRATMQELPTLFTVTSQQWSVDGSPASGDVFFDGNWHTVLAAGLREGVDPNGTATNGAQLTPSVFALDITAPDKLANNQQGAPDCLNARAMDSANPIAVPSGCLGDPANNITHTASGKGYLYPTILWEYTDALYRPKTGPDPTNGGKLGDVDKNHYPDLGMTWSRPAIGRVQVYNVSTSKVEDHFVAIFGGGFDPTRDANEVTLGANSTYRPLLNNSGNFIYMVDIATGKTLYKISAGKYTDITGTVKVRAFGAVPGAINAVDFNTDGYMDALYWGDTLGDIWKLRLGQSSANNVGLYNPLGTCLNGSLADSGTTGCQNKIAGWVPSLIFDGSINKDGLSTTGYTGSGFDPASDAVPQPIFTRPEVVPTTIKDLNGATQYAIIVGTGDRDDLFSDMTTPGRIYVFGDPGPTALSDPASGNFPTPKKESGSDPNTVLYQIPSPDSAQILDLNGTDVASSGPTLLNPGYFIVLNAGEKVNTDATVVNSIVTLATFIPGIATQTQTECGNVAGSARTYAFFYQNSNRAPCFGVPLDASGNCPVSPDKPGDTVDRGFSPTNPRVSLISTASLASNAAGEITGQKVGSEDQVNEPYRTDFGPQVFKKRDWKENP